MDKSEKINRSVKWIEGAVLAIFIPFYSSRLIVEFINEFLRSNWQYSLFEDDKSTIIFANCIMVSLIVVEVIIFYKYRKTHK